MTQSEIKHKILRVCKVAGHDSDFNVVAFNVLCDALVKLGADKKEAEMQGKIDSLYALYEQACQQRDMLMDQQRAHIAALRGQLQ